MERERERERERESITHSVTIVLHMIEFIFKKLVNILVQPHCFIEFEIRGIYGF